MEQLKAFIEKVNSDKELKQRIETLGAGDTDNDEIAALAAEYGFNVTAEDIEQFKQFSCSGCNELGEDQLENIAGGWDYYFYTENRWDSAICNSINIVNKRCQRDGLFSRKCDHYWRDKIDIPNQYRYMCNKGRYHYFGRDDGTYVSRPTH